MKLRLPTRLIQALLTTCAAALTTTTAFAEVLEDYTPVIITDVDQLAEYTESDYTAFLVATNINNSAYRITGAHQYWCVNGGTDTHSLTFSKLEGSSYGGAIYSRAELVEEEFDELLFSQNMSTGLGGAIYAIGTLKLKGNETVMFSQNSTPSQYSYSNVSGGAIYAEGTLNIEENLNVIFSQNSSLGSAPLSGGAIFTNGTINVTGNGNVLFNENAGRAIVLYGTINVIGNNHVEFRKNYVRNGNSYKLEGLYATKGTLNLSAAEEQDIIFYDSLYVERAMHGRSEMTVSFNAPYEFNDGAERKYTGDIVLSGKYAEQDLRDIKAEYTSQELINSLTSEIYATTNLYGGCLRIEDGAIYKGYGINVAANSEATLELRNATLNLQGYDVTINSGTTLALEGENTLIAGRMVTEDGSIMDVTLGSENISTPVLSVTGFWEQGGRLSFNVKYDENAASSSPLRILDTRQDITPEKWNEQNVSVSGTTFDKLQWHEGILYLNLTNEELPSQFRKLDWIGGDMLWNKESPNWREDGIETSFSDSSVVYFGNTGAGIVELEGTLSPRRVLVDNDTDHDYTFTSDYYTGLGYLSGDMQLEKRGEGVLKICTIGYYTGGTVLNGGTLVAGEDRAFGSGGIQIFDGVLDLGNHEIYSSFVTGTGVDVHIRYGVLNTIFQTSGGSVDATDLHIQTSTLKITGAEKVSFTNTNVLSSASGGVIYGTVASTIQVEGNGNVMFSDNSVNASNDNTCGGGAICVAESSVIDLNHNENLAFIANTATASYNCGGAILTEGSTYYERSTINLIGNGNIKFAENVADIEGGAICASSGDLNIKNNDGVSFINNRTFASNSLGGALFLGGHSNLSDNKNIEFIDNYSDGGGAIFCYDADIACNESVSFVNNRAFGSYGGAIYADYGSTFNLCGNCNVAFSGNSSYSCGGAIYIGSMSDVNISANDSVVFRGNYETSNISHFDTYRLCSIHMQGGNLHLAAGEGQEIVFFDTLYAEYSSTVSLNAKIKGVNGEEQEAMGDIVFSGRHAEEDLKAIKKGFTQQELMDSLSTEVYATTNLYGGRLRVEDSAIYKGNGINVAADSAATLRLANGTLEQSGYDVLFNVGTTLDLEGMNNITADVLDMLDGSTLNFDLGSGEGALLSLNAILRTARITVSLSGNLTSEHCLIRLYDAAQYDTSLWSSDNVTVLGTTYDHLFWKNGVLTYAPETTHHLALDDDSEMEDFGDDKRVDIEGNKHKLTVKHPVDLVHLAMENGVVRLEGEENNVVRITLTEDGSLMLAAGAGVNVGDIVSMVANGSADLVISGDIEISDIKAYGKPGNKGTLSYVNMTTAGDYTIENMTISGSLIDVGEGTTLYLVNVDIKADTHITDDPAQVFVQGTHAQLDKTNTWVDKEITAAQDTLLYMCGNTQRSITLAAGSEIVELTSSMFDTVTLTGTDLWLDMTGIAEATYGKDYFTLEFQDLAREMSKAQVGVNNLRVYATLDGEKYTEAYSTSNGGLTTTLYFQVPEPTTSTLSLLALAALAARRRRK